jgi:nitrous oxidase accessory protein
MKAGEFLAIAVFFLLARSGAGETYHVDDYGAADFAKIGEAIAAASDGDEIIVYAGTYHENLVLDKALTLRGVNYPVIDVKFEGVALTILEANCRVEGFTITNSGRGSLSPGVRIVSNSNVVEENKFHMNDDGAIECKGASFNTIAHNEIHYVGDFGIGLSEGSVGNKIIGNKLSNILGSGIVLDGFVAVHGNVIQENSISSCRAAGVGFEDAFDNVVRDNQIVGCKWGIVLTDENSKRNEIIRNTVTNNTYGIFVDEEASQNRLFENTFEDNETHGVDENGGNLWDNGARGNYWSGYAGSDKDGDGAGETPYLIQGGGRRQG